MESTAYTTAARAAIRALRDLAERLTIDHKMEPAYTHFAADGLSDDLHSPVAAWTAVRALRDGAARLQDLGDTDTDVDALIAAADTLADLIERPAHVSPRYDIAAIWGPGVLHYRVEDGHRPSYLTPDHATREAAERHRDALIAAAARRIA